jgi:hypothetical protein
MKREEQILNKTIMKREQIEKGIAAIFEETGIAKAARENNFAEYLQDAMMRLVEWAFTPHKVLNVPDTKRDEIIKQLANYKPTLIIGEPISHWISAEERLPVEDEVLVLNEYGGTTVAFYNHQYKEWNLAVGEIEGSGTIHSKITHWMPIPELPKEK